MWQAMSPPSIQQLQHCPVYLGYMKTCFIQTLIFFLFAQVTQVWYSSMKSTNHMEPWSSYLFEPLSYGFLNQIPVRFFWKTTLYWSVISKFMRLLRRVWSTVYLVLWSFSCRSSQCRDPGVLDHNQKCGPLSPLWLLLHIPLKTLTSVAAMFTLRMLVSSGLWAVHTGNWY